MFKNSRLQIQQWTKWQNVRDDRKARKNENIVSEKVRKNLPLSCVIYLNLVKSCLEKNAVPQELIDEIYNLLEGFFTKE